MKKFRAPDNRQLLADLLSGNTLARRQLNELRKPIKWLGGQCICKNVDPVPDDIVQTSITYRNGTTIPRHPLTYTEFVKLGDSAENAVLCLVINTTPKQPDDE
ncbi:hypothetical protein [Larkinella punicea]|uniref:Uncharacterized protein n=1 Tax=Larkinella punicea TaxID=2315727 RepID=A0A368JLZ4_9BACT|nr:hypothetical protein [Larkinella punicea]RCR68315.1 hypothetical protein DUE52_18135 [Larkinella punicea]